MSISKRTRSALLLAALGAGSAALAQQPVEETPVQVNYCRAEPEVLRQEQTGNAVTLDIAVALGDCTGTEQADVSTGSIEYDLVFVDEEGREVVWHYDKPWDWRPVGDFTLNIEHQASPGFRLEQVRELSVGRCSCAWRQ